MGMQTVRSLSEIELLISSAPVPMLVVDYTPILNRFQHCSVERIATLLEDDEELYACTRLPRSLGASNDWIQLYGEPERASAPDLSTRDFDAARYPELRQDLATQFLAPFRNETSISTEHLAPTMRGDVVVRSHWKALMRDGVPDYTRIVIVDIDISDLREVENSLEVTVESKDRLIASISHELRNPVTSVVGFSDILTSDWATLDDDTRRDMALEIAQQVGDVSEILDDLLAVHAGNDLNVADDILKLAAVLEGINLNGVTVDCGQDIKVRGDALRIRQILRNLIRNSHRYGGETKTLSIDARSDGVTIEMADDGEGITDAVRERLFQPFSHGGGRGSVGLGLAVSRDLARAMGGELRYARRSGWTVFSLDLCVD